MSRSFFTTVINKMTNENNNGYGIYVSSGYFERRFFGSISEGERSVSGRGPGGNRLAELAHSGEISTHISHYLHTVLYRDFSVNQVGVSLPSEGDRPLGEELLSFVKDTFNGSKSAGDHGVVGPLLVPIDGSLKSVLYVAPNGDVGRSFVAFREHSKLD